LGISISHLRQQSDRAGLLSVAFSTCSTRMQAAGPHCNTLQGPQYERLQLLVHGASRHGRIM
jgi:hypothetical protein